MNQPIAHIDPASTAFGTNTRETQSSLGMIFSKMKSLLEIRARPTLPRYREQTFIESSLLDPMMGPEISRTLR